MPLNSNYLQDVGFIELLFVIVIGWMLVALWQRALDNFTFQTLGMQRDSTYHTIVIALTVTLLFIIFVFLYQSMFGGALESGTASAIKPPVPIEKME
jgi:TRAP-type C4-dicarboxylate transport system permease small subunit